MLAQLDAESVVLSGEKNIGCKPRSGRPAPAATTKIKDKVMF